MARQFLEIIDLTNTVHLCNDAVQDPFNLFVGAFSEKSTLAFQAALMAKKLLPIEIRDAFPLCFFQFHGEGAI